MANYILNQYNRPVTAASSATSADNLTYLTPITSGTVRRKKNASDSGVTGDSSNPFYDECILIPSKLSTSVNYYFHGKIKRLSTNQVFYIKLINYENESGDDTVEQYIKTITVQAGDESSWVDVEFIFTPLASFDTIIFQLQRLTSDYKDSARYPTIIYEELSTVNNIISTIGSNISMEKIGVQASPGTMLCINGEEIHIGRTGIYEIRNGIIKVHNFSVAAAAIENKAAEGGIDINELQESEYEAAVELDEKVRAGEIFPNETSNLVSVCIFGAPKTRTINAFTFDYMYKEA